jgi:hypothetical protein
MKGYIKRIADKMLQDCLECSGITVIQGPKWCGKTTTAIQAAQSVIYYAYSRDDGVYIVPISSLKC